MIKQKKKKQRQTVTVLSRLQQANGLLLFLCCYILFLTSWFTEFKRIEKHYYYLKILTPIRRDDTKHNWLMWLIWTACRLTLTRTMQRTIVYSGFNYICEAFWMKWSQSIRVYVCIECMCVKSNGFVFSEYYALHMGLHQIPILFWFSKIKGKKTAL